MYHTLTLSCKKNKNKKNKSSKTECGWQEDIKHQSRFSLLEQKHEDAVLQNGYQIAFPVYFLRESPVLTPTQLDSASWLEKMAAIVQHSLAMKKPAPGHYSKKYIFPTLCFSKTRYVRHVQNHIIFS